MPTHKTDLCLSRETVETLLNCSDRNVQNLAARGLIKKLPTPANSPAEYSESSVLWYLDLKNSGQPIPPTGPFLPEAKARLVSARSVVGRQSPAQTLLEAPEAQQNADLYALPGSVRLTVREAARYLHVTQTWIAEQLRSQRLPYDVVNHAKLIRRSDLDLLPAQFGRRRKK